MADLNPCLMCGANLATRELPPLTIEHLHIAGVRAIIAMLRDERYRDCNKVADDLERTISGATQPPAAGVDATDEMVESYLEAQRAYVMAEDARWGRQIGGGSHRDAIRDACRSGLVAALRTGGGAA